MRSLPLPFRRSALRILPLACTMLAAAPALHADPITYGVTLSPTNGTYAGTGTLTLASAPSASGIATYSATDGQLQGLSLSIDGQTFSLAGDPDASVVFTNGQLTAIDFAETVNAPPTRYTLQLSDGFQLYGNGFGHLLSSGDLTAAVATPPLSSTTPQTETSPTATTSATPEPGSLVLLATALLAGGLFLFRRKRASQS